jgi:hypothetical protein
VRRRVPARADRSPIPRTGLLGQHLPRLPERLQRAGRVAGAVETEHQLTPRPLPQRMPIEKGA